MTRIFGPISTAISICLLFFCVNAFATETLHENRSASNADSLSHSLFDAPLTKILYQVIDEEIGIPVQVGIKPFSWIDQPDSLHPFLQMNYTDGKTGLLHYDRIHTAEAIAITILDYEQTPIDTVQKSDITNYFSFPASSHLNGTSKYPDNTIIYRLRLSVMLSLIDIEQKTTIDAAVIEVADLGHDKKDAVAILFKQFRNQANWEIRRFFSVFSAISPTGRLKNTLMLGHDFHIQPGDIFEIFTPERIAADPSISHYRRTGILKLEQVYPDSSTACIQRKWGRIDTTSFAVLANTPALAFHAYYSPKSTSDYTQFSIDAEFQPFSKFSWLVGGHYHQIRDSYHHLDHGFGFQGSGRFILWRTPKIVVAGQNDLFLDLFFRNDDNGNPVSTIVPGITPSGYLSILLAPNFDLSLGFGYRYAITTRSWVINSEEETGEDQDASWHDEKGPRIKYSGFFFRCGIRLYLF